MLENYQSNKNVTIFWHSGSVTLSSGKFFFLLEKKIATKTNFHFQQNFIFLLSVKKSFKLSSTAQKGISTPTPAMQREIVTQDFGQSQNLAYTLRGNFIEILVSTQRDTSPPAQAMHDQTKSAVLFPQKLGRFRKQNSFLSTFQQILWTGNKWAVTSSPRVLCVY